MLLNNTLQFGPCFEHIVVQTSSYSIKCDFTVWLSFSSQVGGFSQDKLLLSLSSLLPLFWCFAAYFHSWSKTLTFSHKRPKKSTSIPFCLYPQYNLEQENEEQHYIGIQKNAYYQVLVLPIHIWEKNDCLCSSHVLGLYDFTL